MDISALHSSIAKLYLVKSKTYAEVAEIKILANEIVNLLGNSDGSENTAVDTILSFYIKYDNMKISIKTIDVGTIEDTASNILENLLSKVHTYDSEEAKLISDFVSVLLTLITELDLKESFPITRDLYLTNNKKYEATNSVIERIVNNFSTIPTPINKG